MGDGIISQAPVFFRTAAVILPASVVVVAGVHQWRTERKVRRSGQTSPDAGSLAAAQPSTNTSHVKRMVAVMIAVQVLLFVSYYTYVFLVYGRSKFQLWLLPPYNDFYLRQLGSGLTTLVSDLAAAAVLLCAGWWLIRKQRTAFVDAEDLSLTVLGAVAVGWPGVLVYLAVIFALSVVSIVVLIVLRRKTLQDRLIVTPFILPSAIIVLIARQPLLALTHLDKIRF